MTINEAAAKAFDKNKGLKQVWATPDGITFYNKGDADQYTRLKFPNGGKTALVKREDIEAEIKAEAEAKSQAEAQAEADAKALEEAAAKVKADEEAQAEADAKALEEAAAKTKDDSGAKKKDEKAK